MNNWINHEQSVLKSLADLTMKEFGINEGQFFNRYSRSETSRARQTFVLVSTDSGFAKGKVADFLKMDPSFVTYVRRRNYSLRTTVEYIHLKGLLGHIVGGDLETQ